MIEIKVVTSETDEDYLVVNGDVIQFKDSIKKGDILDILVYLKLIDINIVEE